MKVRNMYSSFKDFFKRNFKKGRPVCIVIGDFEEFQKKHKEIYEATGGAVLKYLPIGETIRGLKYYAERPKFLVCLPTYHKICYSEKFHIWFNKVVVPSLAVDHQVIIL